MGRPKKFDPETAVAQAAQTFRERGYAEASPQELADSIGIGKGSLYHAFGSKHELFLRSLEHYADASLAELRMMLDEGLPIRLRVRRLLIAFLDADLDDPERCGCLVVNSAVELRSRDTPAADLLSRSFEATESVLYEAFVAAQQCGEIAPDRDPRALARLVQSSMVGLRVLVKTTDDRDRLLATVEATVAVL